MVQPYSLIFDLQPLPAELGHAPVITKIGGRRGGNNAYIKRCFAEYRAGTAYLVENYRSSRAVTEAANALIGQKWLRC